VSKFAACAQAIVRASVVAFLGATFLSGFSSQLLAAEDEDELEEVQVTGTRIQVPNATASNPVTSITGEEMRNLGIVNVADALTQLVPQNLSTYMPTLIGDDQAGTGGGGVDTLDRSSYFIGNTIANLRGLDPTFGTRTLTMVDGRRVVSTSNQADVVDMNIIPSNLLQRMDVVTGGASASYGSGAMAGVVNLVLNNRLTGFNLDVDYGINEAGDGGSPHISASGGLPLFGGRGHALIGVEWQRQSAIRDCAAARSWCAESRAMFNNSTGSTSNPAGILSPLPGFENMPARFEMGNVRYGQFSQNGAIYHNSVTNVSGYRFSDDGQSAEEYAYGYRGGTGGSVMNGDGPLVTSGTAMRPSSERKTLFGNFEFNITERTTAYLQTNYARTSGENKQRYTTATTCARFDTAGVLGDNAAAGEALYYSSYSGALATGEGQQLVRQSNGSLLNVGGTLYPPPATARARQFNTGPNGGIVTAFATFLDLPAAGFGTGTAAFPSVSQGNNPPYWSRTRDYPNGPPSVNPTTGRPFFAGNAVPTYIKVRYIDPSTRQGDLAYAEAEYWLLEYITLTNVYDTGTVSQDPTLGRNSYAFLNTLGAEALAQVKRAFGNSPSAGGGSGVDTLYGANPCTGSTAIRKVWNPQIQQWSSNESETMRIVAGVRGRFGRDWRWDGYYQYGQTESSSKAQNVATRIRMAFALDAVIDDRAGSPTFGQPVCRVTRDGVPSLDTVGRPLSDPEALAAIGENCRPLNMFGSTSFTSLPEWGSYDAEQTQRDALEYAFVDTRSSGKNSLQTLSFNTSGTLWQGWGAGPLTSAFGLEVRRDTVANAGSTGDNYLRADLASSWQDAYGGSTTVTEGYTELNLPLVSGQPGVNLWSVNGSVRYSSYHNKGGAGTTGESATQGTTNWKLSTVFEPFDWIRLRLTRSRDMRAAGYRDLFLFQPSIPDSQNITNPWRERTATSTENQTERYGQVRVGNPNLKPESSNTLTLGVVLSPSGWAQGMRVSADYYNIRVRDGIGTSNRASNPVQECWTESGNEAAEYFEGYPVEGTGINGLIDLDNEACKDLNFAVNEDGSRNLHDIVSYNASRPSNGLPYQRRGIDVSWSYLLPLSRAFESLPGSLSLTVRAQRALESSGLQVNSNANGFYDQTAANPPVAVPNGTNPVNGPNGPNTRYRTINPDACGARYDALDPENNAIAGYAFGIRTPEFAYSNYSNRYTCIDQIGQIRSSVFVPGVAAAPKWTGNITATYLLGDLTTSLSARYTGASFLDRTWGDSPDDLNYRAADGRFLNGSVDNNWVKPYFNFSLNGSYNLKVGDMKQFQVFGSVNNLFNKSPPFTGGGLSGASAQYHDTMGRAYRMGVRMKF
jgi:outer membrane receptor protein involved in Fe transport